MKYILTVLILPFILSSCISYRITEKDLFHINKVSRLNKSDTLQEVYFTTEDSVQLYGWFIKNNNAKGTFLYFGGNGFFLANPLTLDVVNTLTNFNMNLFIFDYRGLGRSEGSPTIDGIYKDGEAAYKYICSRKDVDSTKIIIYAHSIGTFVATQVARFHNSYGVILEAPISNAEEMRDAVIDYYAPWYLRWFVNVSADSSVMALNNLKLIGNIKQPILIIAGSNDKLAPPAMAKEVYEASRSKYKKLEIIPYGEHKNIYFTNDGGRRDYFNKIVSEYLNNIFKNN